ncbi:MAG: hypothetical protein M3362_12080 [Acidobacteriota bacterium]|nr:hypothetical protein [Acidobacteriota bacterium]
MDEIEAHFQLGGRALFERARAPFIRGALELTRRLKRPANPTLIVLLIKRN